MVQVMYVVAAVSVGPLWANGQRRYEKDDIDVLEEQEPPTVFLAERQDY